MGLSYSSDCFYGTFAPVESKIGKKLRRLMDKGEDWNAAGEGGVGLDIVGSLNNSPEFVVVRADDSALSVHRDDDITAPRALVTVDGWELDVRRYLAKHKIAPSDLPKIGWYFAGSVS